MSFGRNPHVAKAQAEELKAQSAKDEIAAEQAWREAARQWDRAANREDNAARKAEYEAKAEAARTRADHPEEDSAGTGDDAAPADPRLLN